MQAVTTPTPGGPQDEAGPLFLPPEVWDLVLSHLALTPSAISAFACVCRMFRDLVHDRPSILVPRLTASAKGARALARRRGGCFDAFETPSLVFGLIDGLLRRARRPSHPSGLRHHKIVETVSVDLTYVTWYCGRGDCRWALHPKHRTVALPHAPKRRLRVCVFLDDDHGEVGPTVDPVAAAALLAAECNVVVDIEIRTLGFCRSLQRHKRTITKLLAKPFDRFFVPGDKIKMMPRLIGPTLWKLRKAPRKWDLAAHPDFGRFLIDSVRAACGVVLSWWRKGVGLIPGTGE